MPVNAHGPPSAVFYDLIPRRGSSCVPLGVLCAVVAATNGEQLFSSAQIQVCSFHESACNIFIIHDQRSHGNKALRRPIPDKNRVNFNKRKN